MEDFATEEQRVEALRDWWRHNAGGVVLGLAAAVAAILGWQYWQGQRVERTLAASAAYDRVAEVLAAGDNAKVREQGQLLINDQPGSSYAVLAALAMARAALAADDAPAALAHLDWVAAQAGPDEFKDIARLRAARVLAGAGELEQAAARLDAVKGQGFAAERDELRGDLAYARKDYAQARSAWQAALAARGPAAGGLISLKLDNLPET